MQEDIFLILELKWKKKARSLDKIVPLVLNGVNHNFFVILKLTRFNYVVIFVRFLWIIHV